MEAIAEGTRREFPLVVPLSSADPPRCHTATVPMVRCEQCGVLYNGWAFEDLCSHFTEGKLGADGSFGRYTEGALYWRTLEDGYEVCVLPMTYGKARLCYGEQGFGGGILNGFCYEDPALAILAAEVWTGEGDPLDGWHRNPFNGRRREGGDPAQETVRA